MRQVSNESVEKVHLISSTSFSGVSLPYPSKRSSIVDRITKPLFLASYEELCSESFSTDSIQVIIHLKQKKRGMIRIRDGE